MPVSVLRRLRRAGRASGAGDRRVSRQRAAAAICSTLRWMFQCAARPCCVRYRHRPVNIVLASILIYTALQLLVIFLAARRPKSEADYLLAGRQLGPWLSTFSVFATWFGAEHCVGAAGEAYKGGWAAVMADPFGCTLGLVLTGLFFAAALWRSGIVTLADLFRNRYGAGVERLAALIMIPGSLMWAAAQIRAFGQVLSSV